MGAVGKRKDEKRKKQKERGSRRREERFKKAGGLKAGERKDIRTGKRTEEEVRKDKGKPDKKQEKPTIDLTPEVGQKAPNKQSVIDLTKQGQPKEDPQIGKAVAVGAGIGAVGAGAVLGAPAIGAAAAGLAARFGLGTTSRAVQSGFAQQAAAIPGKDKIVSGTNAVIRNTFKANAKTQGLTQSLLGKVGLSIPAASILLGAIGSYPFAGFIKEEALQTLSFGTKVAIDSGDLEGAQAAIDQINEVLNPTAWEKILGAIPYANILKQLSEFYSAAALKNSNDQKALDKKRQIAEGEIESDFARDRRVSDEAARERELKAQGEDTARFDEIREENQVADNEQKALNAEYFQLLRDKKFDEAEEFRKINFPT